MNPLKLLQLKSAWDRFKINHPLQSRPALRTELIVFFRLKPARPTAFPTLEAIGIRNDILRQRGHFPPFNPAS